MPTNLTNAMDQYTGPQVTKSLWPPIGICILLKHLRGDVCFPFPAPYNHVECGDSVTVQEGLEFSLQIPLGGDFSVGITYTSSLAYTFASQPCQVCDPLELCFENSTVNIWSCMGWFSERIVTELEKGTPRHSKICWEDKIKCKCISETASVTSLPPQRVRPTPGHTEVRSAVGISGERNKTTLVIPRRCDPDRSDAESLLAIYQHTIVQAETEGADLLIQQGDRVNNILSHQEVNLTILNCDHVGSNMFIRQSERGTVPVFVMANSGRVAKVRGVIRRFGIHAEAGGDPVVFSPISATRCYLAELQGVVDEDHLNELVVMGMDEQERVIYRNAAVILPYVPRSEMQSSMRTSPAANRGDQESR